MIKINRNVLLITSAGLSAVIIIVILLIAFTQIEGTQLEKMETFPSDKYGHYQTWCESNQGEWFDDTIECKFEHEKDHAKAMMDLDYIQHEKYTIPEKYVLDMCHLLGITCMDGLQFQGYFDFYSNYLTYDYQSDKADFSFRLMDDVLEYKGKKLVDGKWIGSDEHWVKLELTHSPETPKTPTTLDQFTIPDTLKKSIRERVDNGTHVSLFVGIIDEDGTDQYYYGNVAKDEELIDENTVFETGSISKVLTSLILADMVERGEVSLDDPIDKFLPENVKTPTWNGQKITLWNLATHTSGLPVMPNYPPNPDLDKEYEYSKDGLYEYLADYEMSREIGSQYEYSNTGGSLLGHVLSLQAGKTYEQALKERILDKLGMDSTCVHQCDEIRDRFAKPHNPLGELVDEVGLDEDMAGAGGVKSSGKDLLVLLSHAMSLKNSELKEVFVMTQTPNHQINELLSIGLGWHIIEKNEQTIILHNGATDGFASFFGFDPDSNQGVVVLTNSHALVDNIGLELLGFNFE
ncbi:beta-lactamase family protein [archaeon]|nr:beta-lactamase family protein [archaeon]